MIATAVRVTTIIGEVGPGSGERRGFETLMVHLVWGWRCGIVVGFDRVHEIKRHADLAVLVGWKGYNFWDGCGVIRNDLVGLRGSCCLKWSGALSVAG